LLPLLLLLLLLLLSLLLLPLPLPLSASPIAARVYTRILRLDLALGAAGS
jgi:hypothetical protein